MKRVVITGGCGFIGSNLIRLFMKDPAYTVICVDRLSYSGNLANIEEFRGNSRFEFIQADIRDSKAMDPVIARADQLTTTLIQP